MSIGEVAYSNALKRLAELKAETAEIEGFIRLCDRFAGAPKAAVSKDAPPAAVQPLPDENGESGSKGSSVLAVARLAIRSAGHPLKRGALLDAAKENGIELNMEKPARYIGTIMWRARDEFVNIPDHGYWFKNEPYSAADYRPAAPGAHPEMKTAFHGNGTADLSV